MSEITNLQKIVKLLPALTVGEIIALRDHLWNVQHKIEKVEKEKLEKLLLGFTI
jgi:hypothetical protein